LKSIRPSRSQSCARPALAPHDLGDRQHDAGLFATGMLAGTFLALLIADGACRAAVLQKSRETAKAQNGCYVKLTHTPVTAYTGGNHKI